MIITFVAGAGRNGTVKEYSLVKKPDEQTKEMFHLYHSFCKSNDVSFISFSLNHNKK